MQTQMTNYPADKKQLYPLLVSQLSGLIQGELDVACVPANLASVLYELPTWRMLPPY